MNRIAGPIPTLFAIGLFLIALALVLQCCRS